MPSSRDALGHLRPYLNENHAAYSDAFATDRTTPHSLRAVRAQTEVFTRQQQSVPVSVLTRNARQAPIGIRKLGRIHMFHARQAPLGRIRKPLGRIHTPLGMFH